MLRTTAALFWLALPAGLLAADRPAAPKVAAERDLPPLNLSASFEPPTLPPGQAVSQPLQPPAASVESVAVDPFLATPAGVEAPPAPPPPPRHFAHTWTALEFLLWWPKGQPLPPLVSGSQGGVPVVLVGGGGANSEISSGGRFSKGYALDDAGSRALSVTYLFLGTRTDHDAVSTLGQGRPRSIGRPFINAVTGAAEALPVAQPGLWEGQVDVARTVRVSGWEATHHWGLVDGPAWRIQALAGYRYFMANEGLRVEQVTVFPAAADAPAARVGIADQIDAHNRFHGGQFGLVADWTRGNLSIELAGKVGLGRGITVVRVSGQTNALVAGEAPASLPAGVLGLATNTGRAEQSEFAVLPEASVRVGYHFLPRSKVFVGYNFIYLSEAVRPGDQIDRTLDPGQIPYLTRGLNAGERPLPLLVRSDFWVQGLSFGLEYSY